MGFRIPSKFSLGGLNYEVKITPELNNGEDYGEWDGAGCVITIAESARLDHLSRERMEQVFCHELTHAILNFIGNEKLNDNEVFVDTFAQGLYQAIKTME